MTGDSSALRILEALLFASGEPVSEEQMSACLPQGSDIKALIAELQQAYAHRGVNLKPVGDCWAFRTAPDVQPHLKLKREVHRRLSQAALETLSVIAYHQPVTRAEIEEIRGKTVSRGTLEVLLQMGWIAPKGRRRSPGKPTTWGTNESFLDHFGLRSIADLPGLDELKAAGLLDARPASEVYDSLSKAKRQNLGLSFGVDEADDDDADDADDDTDDDTDHRDGIDEDIVDGGQPDEVSEPLEDNGPSDVKPSANHGISSATG